MTTWVRPGRCERELLTRCGDRGWALFTTPDDLIVAQALEEHGFGHLEYSSPFVATFVMYDAGREAIAA